MLGTSLNSRGGISQVEKSITSHWPKCRYTIDHVTTHQDGCWLRKVSIFLVALSLFVIHLLNRRPQILHIHFSTGISILRKSIFIIPAKLLGIRILLHSHTGEMQDYLQGTNHFLRKYVETSLNLADALVITNSKDIPIYKKYYKRSTPIVLKNSTSLHGDSSDLESGNILTVGSLGERKGTPTLLSAIPEVLRSFPKAQFVLAGDGEINSVKDIAMRMGIAENISVLGWVDRDHLRTLYLSSCLFVLPSLHEGMPVAILEAMSYGLPVISTDVNGIPDVVIQRETGFLIKPGQVEELSTLIIRLLSNAKLRKLLGKNGKQRVEAHFSHSAVSRDLIAIYDRILS